MSVLFDALEKAAKDYRTQKAPVVVRLVRVSRPKTSLGRWTLLVSAMGVLVFAAAVAGWVTAPDERYNPSEAQQAEAQPVGENGIALSADSLDPEAKLQTDLAQIEAQLSSMKDGDFDPQDPAIVEPESLTDAALEHVPSETQALVVKAEMLTDKRQWARALRAYDAALVREPGHRSALVGKAALLGARAGKGDLERLDAMLDHHAYLSEIHAARAHILAQEGREDQALAAWEKALELEPQRREYLLGLAVLYDRMGQIDEALDAYAEVPPPLPAESQRRYDYLRARGQVAQSDPPRQLAE